MTSSDSTTRRVALVIGDTPGHVFPALAIAHAWQRLFDGVEVLLIGPREGPASSLVKDGGCRVAWIDARPLARAGVFEKAAAVATVIVTASQARRLLVEHGARLAIGMGGFASGGVLIAARSLGLRAAIHESNVEPGMANELLGPLVHRIYLGHASTGSAFAAGRQLVTGNPIRASIAALAAHAPRERNDRRRAHVLVIGGLRGAGFLADAVPDLLRRIAARGFEIAVHHQGGDVDLEFVRNAYATRNVGVTVCPFIDDMAEEYRWADLVIARAGGGTIAELAAAGLPALLVPLGDAAADHQVANARMFAAAGGGFWTREADWQPDLLAEQLATLLGDGQAWARRSAAARALAVPDAASRIVNDCERMMAGRW